eukprot:GAHX01002279.1.p1 GENE.GAHX01002279.1~~GAHX01002279.1.p1  ORF type:complete len:555 (+),score=79.45 GAHX01002279.1:39-1703(+)
MKNQGGRPKDTIWANYLEVYIGGDKKAKCKICKTIKAPRADRMKIHYEACLNKKKDDKINLNSNEEYDSTSENTTLLEVEQPKIVDWLINRNGDKKTKMDISFITFIISSNTPFRLVEEPCFRQFIQQLDHSYTLPSRNYLSTTLLDKLYSSMQIVFKEKIKNQKLTIFQDGWTNINNQSLIVNSVISEGKSYIIDMVAPNQNKKDARYLSGLLSTSIERLKNSFHAETVAVCTDNASVMNSMRDIIVEKYPDIESIGFSAHILNLLAKDISNTRVLDQVKEVQKYFKYHHTAAAYLSSLSGAFKPVLNAPTRWCSSFLMVGNFLKNLKFYMSATQTENIVNDATIRSQIMNIQLQNSAKQEEKKLEEVYNSIVILQSNKATLADVVAEVIRLRKSSRLNYGRYKESFSKRVAQIITSAHLIAYLFHPTYLGAEFTENELEKVRFYLNDINPLFVPEMAKFQAKAKPYPRHFFEEGMLKLNPIVWWNAAKSYKINGGFADRIVRLFRISPTSASIERLFSHCSYIQTKTRNKLGNDKLRKILFCYLVLAEDKKN